MGNKYIKKLAADLKEYGKGYSYDQLKRMSRFTNWFTITEIRAQPMPQIPWSSIIEIMNKSSSKEALWYVAKTTLSKVTAKIGIILAEIPDYLADKLNDIDEI